MYNKILLGWVGEEPVGGGTTENGTERRFGCRVYDKLYDIMHVLPQPPTFRLTSVILLTLFSLYEPCLVFLG